VTATAPSRTELPPVAAPAESLIRRAIASCMRLFGSMKLAVCLVLTLLLLTWLGTLAQVGKSTNDVQREYFESWVVIAELPVSVWGHALFHSADGSTWALRCPLPGAYPVLALLFVNLIVGGLMRMKWQLRNTGILITHLGIAFLLVAGFVKMHYSYSGMLDVYEWPTDGNASPGRVYETSQYRSAYDDELVLLIDRGDTIEERVIPEQELWGARGDGVVTVTGSGLPFRIQVHHWIDFVRVLPKGPMVKTPMPVVDGVYLEPAEWPPGEQPHGESEFGGCYVTIVGDGQERIEGILRNVPRGADDVARYPLSFTMRGQRYGLDLRRVTRDVPFKVRLDKFQKKDHPGTMDAMDFRSFIEVVDSKGTEQAQVFMNNPLRRDGFTLYQTSWGPQFRGRPMGGPPWYSEFEVSHNPSDMWPKLACYVIAAGLVLHFASKLRRFLDSSTRKALTS
jgi:hypothetical protein